MCARVWILFDSASLFVESTTSTIADIFMRFRWGEGEGTSRQLIVFVDGAIPLALSHAKARAHCCRIRRRGQLTWRRISCLADNNFAEAVRRDGIRWDEGAAMCFVLSKPFC